MYNVAAKVPWGVDFFIASPAFASSFIERFFLRLGSFPSPLPLPAAVS
jgi:hypothetical protein